MYHGNIVHTVSLHGAGTLTVVALMLLTYLLPDAKSKPDHTRVVKIVPVSSYILMCHGAVSCAITYIYNIHVYMSHRAIQTSPRRQPAWKQTKAVCCVLGAFNKLRRSHCAREEDTV